MAGRRVEHRLLPRAGEMAHQQVGDGAGLFDRDEVGGSGDDREPCVGDARDQGAGLGRAGDLVLGTGQDERGHADAAEFAPHVEGGQGLAGGDVAAGVGGADHLHRPLGDRGLRGGETAGEPALGRRAGDGVEPVAAHDHPSLAELVRRAEPGRGGDQHEGGEPLGVPQRQLEAQRPAERAARVPEPLDPERVQRGQQPPGEVADGPARMRGGAAVPGQIEPQHSPLRGQFGHLTVPHVPCGAQ